MGKLSEYVKAILIVVLKLILMLLKKRGKTPIDVVKDDRKLCLRRRTSRKYVSSTDKDETTDDSSSSITSASKLSVSSGIGSSICSTDSHSATSQGGEVFDFESPEICSTGAEIERLRIENKALREKLSQKKVGSRNVHQSQPTEPTDFVERSPVFKKGSTSQSEVMTSTPRQTASEDDIDDIVQKKLKLKLQLEREENSRLQNYINDVMYMVLETRPNLLEK